MLCLALLLMGLPRPAPAAEGTIRAGDVLEIIVFGYQDLSRRATVSTEGRLDYPFLEDVVVEGMALDRLQEVLVERLTPYTGDVPVAIQRAERTVVWVTVLGAVGSPGTYPVPSASFLQTAFTQAGGLTPGSDLRGVRLLRGQQEETVDLEAFFREGDIDSLPRLQDGDVVIVPGWSAREHRVRILGGVRAPGWYEPEPDADVMDLILQAGGAHEGDLRRVQFIHQQDGRRVVQELDLKELLEELQIDAFPKVTGGDLIVVPEDRTIFTWGRFIGFVRDASVLLSTYIIVTRL